MGPIGLCIGTLIIVWISRWIIYRLRDRRWHGQLPPGSMGFPVLGETVSFLQPYTSFDIQPFVKKRMERYGPIFKTSLVGQPVIISADPELNHFVLQQEGRLFQSWYPDTFQEVFGRQSMGFIHGLMYKYLKSLILSLFSGKSLKENILSEINQFARRTLISWSAEPSIEFKDASSAMIFELTAKKLIGYDPTTCSESLRETFVAFNQGLLSFPINIPGTAHHRCVQGRKNVLRVLKKMLEERRSSPERRKGDFFDRVIDELQNDQTMMTEAIALDLIFLLLFTSFETTSLALTMAVKYLTQHPQVLNKLTEEQEEILRRKKNPDDEITWEEYKSMTFTLQVLNETIRLSNISLGVFRKTMQDVEIKGYTIPAGWAVMVCPPAAHLNPNTYEDPLSFNPWRWEGVDTNGGSQNFMPFGGGMRLCVGADFSKLQMTVFLHHLVTKYRWSFLKGGETVRNPALSLPNGFHIQLFPKDK